MEIKGSTQMTKTWKPNFTTKVLTTLFCLPFSLGTAAEASSYRNYGSPVGECNQHGWILKQDGAMLSIGKSHDFVISDGDFTARGGWTYNRDGGIRLHHEDITVDVSPRCYGGGYRF